MCPTWLLAFLCAGSSMICSAGVPLNSRSLVLNLLCATTLSRSLVLMLFPPAPHPPILLIIHPCLQSPTTAHTTTTTHTNTPRLHNDELNAVPDLRDRQRKLVELNVMEQVRRCEVCECDVNMGLYMEWCECIVQFFVCVWRWGLFKICCSVSIPLLAMNMY